MFHQINKRITLELKLRILYVLKHLKKFNPDEQILIFSDPRGGSTWLTEIIHTIPNTAIIWEPFNINEVEAVKKLGFGWRQYIPENQSWPEAKKVITKICSGKIVNEWTMLVTGVKDYYRSNQLIVKICRGNMLLPWIANQIKFKFSPIYLVRHPFAVVSSQIKQGGWNSPFKKFEAPKIPFNGVYQDHNEFLSTLTTKEEILTAYWCLTNKIPLNHRYNNKKWITVYYEDLLLNPESNINRIFQKWGLPVPLDIFLKIQQKSYTTNKNTNILDTNTQLFKWKDNFTDDQLKKMMAVLDYFHIQIYSTSALPHYS
jgi:hypothetical protein